MMVLNLKHSSFIGTFLLFISIIISYIHTKQINIFSIFKISICIIILLVLIRLISFYIANRKRGKDLQYFPLFKVIETKDLKAFKTYIKANNIKVNQMHLIYYYGQVTPIISAMDNDSYDIFCYMLEQGYDVNAKDVSHVPLIYATYYPQVKYIEELLKYPIDFYIKNPMRYPGNAMEVAVWRGRTKVVKNLLRSGMKFSLKEYNMSQCGKELLPWNQVKREIKVLLLENYVFDQKKKMFYMNELCLQKKINVPIFNSRHYFIENLLEC